MRLYVKQSIAVFSASETLLKEAGKIIIMPGNELHETKETLEDKLSDNRSKRTSERGMKTK